MFFSNKKIYPLINKTLGRGYEAFNFNASIMRKPSGTCAVAICLSNSTIFQKDSKVINDEKIVILERTVDIVTL